jgi:hypothetical protein
VEIVDYYKVTVHPDVAEAVDAILQRRPTKAEVRWMDETGEVRKQAISSFLSPQSGEEGGEKQEEKILTFYLFGTNRFRLEQVAKEKHKPLRITNDLKQADLFLTTRSYYRRKPQKVRDAEALGIPIYVLRSNNVSQLRQCLDNLYPEENQSSYAEYVQRLLSAYRNSQAEQAKAKLR